MRVGPSYPRTVADVMRERDRSARGAFTAAATPPQGRPYIPWTVSCSVASLWASTTSGSFTPIARAAGWRSHPYYDFLLRVSAPVLGSEARIRDEGGSVIWGPQSFASGVSEVSGTFDLSSYDFYDDTYVEFEIRSITAGQTSRLCVARFAGYGP